MQLIEVAGSSNYPVYIGDGLLAQLGGLYRRHGLRGRALLVTDERVAELYGDQALKSLAANDIEARAVGVPAGETSKSLEIADLIYERLIQNGFERDAVVIALGGGVVGDLAGFVAATYLRGVGLVQVPTTLLAQVDSAVGGKTGVNHPLGKNLIGAFHSPKLVVADLAALKTLPEQERRSGFAEVIKYGLIGDRALFDQLEAELDELLLGTGGLERVVARCVEIKARIVAADEREASERKALNFGHTLGHALEALTEYQHFTHGEAVLWGMLGEAYLSFRYGALREMEFVRIRRLLERVERPPLPEISPEALLAHARRDKKNQGGRVVMCWLRHIGSCQAGPVDPDQLVRALDFWERVA